ncbi:MAG TPA: hypothetical protein VNS53_05655 [Sphingomicrobium sp.]|jgi:hypothetical protein|nr:hypothetical protein [Sphingomicrobium sp.]
MSLENLDYYRQRAREERAIAEKAGNPEAAKVHLDLAKSYEALVEHFELLPPTRAASSGENEERL